MDNNNNELLKLAMEQMERINNSLRKNSEMLIELADLLVLYKSKVATLESRIAILEAKINKRGPLMS